MINSFKNISYKRHFHSTYSISLILEGECFLNIENKNYRASKGSIRVINPYQLHEIKHSSWKHKNLLLSKKKVKSILGKEPCFQNIIDDDRVSSILLKDNIDLEQLDWLLKYLASNYLDMDCEIESLHVKRLQKAKLFMEINAMRGDISIDEIAFHSGFSKYHFIREFKKEFGLTPYQYIHNLKIDSARRMLQKGISLSQIAQICGFNDQSHFIKIYKKFYGHTPSKVSNNLLY